MGKDLGDDMPCGACACALGTAGGAAWSLSQCPGELSTSWKCNKVLLEAAWGWQKQTTAGSASQLLAPAGAVLLGTALRAVTRSHPPNIVQRTFKSPGRRLQQPRELTNTAFSRASSRKTQRGLRHT